MTTSCWRRAVVLALVVVPAAALAACGESETAPGTVSAEPGLPVARTPERLLEACGRIAMGSRARERCPRLLPEPAPDARVTLESQRDFEAGDCGWLAGFTGGLGRGQAGARVHHVLVGGVCRPLPLDVARGRWPRDPDAVEGALRLVGFRPLDPGFPRSEQAWARPAVLGRTTVRGQPALVLRYEELPASGTIHGGHEAIVWNEAGAGWALSLHFERGSRAQRVALLRRVAASMPG